MQALLFDELLDLCLCGILVLGISGTAHTLNGLGYLLLVGLSRGLEVAQLVLDPPEIVLEARK
jgi:hypothetical protein